MPQDAAAAAACSIEPGWLPSGDGEAAVTWFLPARPGPRSDTAVVLVGPLAHEEQTTALGVVALARRLAEGGIATLALELAGTAQGRGTLADADVGERWAADVRAAAQHVRDAGHGHVVVAGIRVGALIAAHALVHDPVDELVVWAPVLSGRRYVRELQVLQAAATTDAGEVRPGVTVAGHHLSPTLVAHLKGLDAGRLEGKPAARCTVVDTAERLAQLDPTHPLVGEETGDRIVAADTDDWLFTAPDEFPAPFADIELVATHLERRADAAAALLGGSGAGTVALGTAVELPPRTHVFEHRGVAIRERHVEFGAGRRGGPGPLRGILAEPSGEVDLDVALLAVTTVGPGRIFVDLARDAAAAGRTCLRLDVAGFGLSERRDRGGWADHYRPDASDDLAVAVDHLVSLGYRSVRLVGFCAGAWAALHTRPRPEVTGIAAINVQLPIRSRLLHRRVWPGMSRPAAARARFGQHPRVHWFVERFERNLPVPGPGVRRVGSHVAAGTDVVLAFAEGDVGQTYYESHVGRPGGLRASRRPQVWVRPGLGHLPSGDARDLLLADLIRWSAEA